MGRPNPRSFFLDQKKAVGVFAAFFNIKFTAEAQRKKQLATDTRRLTQTFPSADLAEGKISSLREKNMKYLDANITQHYVSNFMQMITYRVQMAEGLTDFVRRSLPCLPNETFLSVSSGLNAVTQPFEEGFKQDPPGKSPCVSVWVCG